MSCQQSVKYKKKLQGSFTICIVCYCHLNEQYLLLQTAQADKAKWQYKLRSEIYLQDDNMVEINWNRSLVITAIDLYLFDYCTECSRFEVTASVQLRIGKPVSQKYEILSR